MQCARHRRPSCSDRHGRRAGYRRTATATVAGQMGCRRPRRPRRLPVCASPPPPAAPVPWHTGARATTGKDAERRRGPGGRGPGGVAGGGGEWLVGLRAEPGSESARHVAYPLHNTHARTHARTRARARAHTYTHTHTHTIQHIYMDIMHILQGPQRVARPSARPPARPPARVPIAHAGDGPGMRPARALLPCSGTAPATGRMGGGAGPGCTGPGVGERLARDGGRGWRGTGGAWTGVFANA